MKSQCKPVQPTILMRWPIALGGRFLLNLARTDPLAPWGRVTLPQMALTFVFFVVFPGTGVLFLAWKQKNVPSYSLIADDITE